MSDITLEPRVTEWSQPWATSSNEGLWTPSGDRWAPSIRNDALWAALWAEREAILPLCREWRAAAEADGWTLRPTYGDHESIEIAFTGEREGFKLSGLCRPGKPDKSMPEAAIHIWGPDRLAIKPPLIYDMGEISQWARHCYACDKFDVETQRVGFAGRVCADCLPEQRRRIETRGWTA